MKDLLSVEVTNFQDVVDIVYGEDSDNAFATARFLELYDAMDEWDEDEMWRLQPDDRDARLYKILAEV